MLQHCLISVSTFYCYFLFLLKCLPYAWLTLPWSQKTISYCCCIAVFDGTNYYLLPQLWHNSFIFCFLNWRCESFSTYPRTYDLVHAWLLFSEIEKQGCSVEDLLIEMDRIMRPQGYAIIRDKVAVINHIKKLLPAVRWDDWSSDVKPKKDALWSGDERVLIVRKKLWNQTL